MASADIPNAIPGDRRSWTLAILTMLAIRILTRSRNMRAHLQSGPEGEGGPAPPQVAATYLPGRAAYPAALCAGALPGRPATARRPRRYRPLAAFARARLGRAMVAAVVVLFPLWLLAAASTPAGAQEPPVICIDPGHPSEVNPGFTVQNGTTETHIDWVVARELEKLLSQKGFRVVMTKSREKQFVRNKERALIANRAGPAIMVRLHCDSSSSRGYALYYPDRTGTKEGMTGPSEDVRSRSHRAAETLAKA